MTCAFAVRGALKKFPGVESVDVSLNKGLATVQLKPGNSVTPEQFWEAVKKNGFTPKETRVVVRGEIVPEGGKSRLKVTGTARIYDLIFDSLGRLAGKTVTLEGTITPLKDTTKAPPIQVLKVRE